MKYSNTAAYFIDGAVKAVGEFSMDDRPVSLYGLSTRGRYAWRWLKQCYLNSQWTMLWVGLNDLKNMGISANQIYLRRWWRCSCKQSWPQQSLRPWRILSIKPERFQYSRIKLNSSIGWGRRFRCPALQMQQSFMSFVIDGNASYWYLSCEYAVVTNLALANPLKCSPMILSCSTILITRWSRFIGAILPFLMLIQI